MNYKLKIAGLHLVPQFLRRRMMVSRYEQEVSLEGESELLELRKIVRPGWIAVDVGCNIGSYSYELSRLGAKVYALEPNPKLAALVESLRLKNVEVVRVAASSEDGTAELNVPLEHAGSHGWGSLRQDPSIGKVEKISVATRCLDNLGLGKIDFIKIDVEGFEEHVLKGAAEMVERDRPVLLIEVEERHNAGGVMRIVDSLRALGYRCRYFRHGQWRDFEPADLPELQDLDRLAEQEARQGSRRGVDYVNNFLFLPKGTELGAQH